MSNYLLSRSGISDTCANGDTITIRKLNAEAICPDATISLVLDGKGKLLKEYMEEAVNSTQDDSILGYIVSFIECLKNVDFPGTKKREDLKDWSELVEHGNIDTIYVAECFAKRDTKCKAVQEFKR